MCITGNRIATVGLDRFLRVYDTSKTHGSKIDSVCGNSKIDCSSKLICSAYLKNRLNCCILADSESNLPKTKKVRKQGALGDDDKLDKNVNFDSDEDNEDESDDNRDHESSDGDSVEVEDNDDDEEEEEDDDQEEDDDEEEEEDDDIQEEVEAHENDNSEDDSQESDEEADEIDKKRKGKGQSEYSSRKQRVAAVARSAKTARKKNDAQYSKNKKRKT